MNTPTTSSTPPLSVPAAAPELVRRLAMILAGLVALIARRFLRMPHLAGMTVRLCGRLGRVARRLGRAITPPAKPRAKRARRDGGGRARAPSLPAGRGWLVRELGWEAAGFGCQLEALLGEPATAAVLAEFPAAGRVLRPLCRMLGVTPPAAMAAAVAPPAPAPAEVPPGWRIMADIGMADGLAAEPGLAASG